MDLDVAASRVQCNRAAGVHRSRAKVKSVGPAGLTGIHHDQRIGPASLQRAGYRRGRRYGGVVHVDTLHASLQMVAIAVIHIVEISKRCPVLLGASDEAEGLALVVQHENPAAGDLALAASSRRWFRTCHASMRRSNHNLIIVSQVKLKAIYNDIPTGRGRGGSGNLIHTKRPVDAIDAEGNWTRRVRYI